MITDYPDSTHSPHYGIKFEPIVDSDQVHHMILYACDEKPTALTGSPQVIDKMPCTALRYAWAVGAKDFCLPIKTKAGNEDAIDTVVGVKVALETRWHALGEIGAQ